MTQSRRLHPPIVALALALAPLAAAAQTGPCGVGNVRNWCVHEDSPGVAGTAQANDLFGAALAFGDFDGDGFDDLAIGSPYEAYFLDASCGELMFCENGGLVHVVFGSATGLVASSAVLIDYGIVHAVMGSFARVGYALAAGRFDNDNFADLVIGVPGVQNGFLTPQRGTVEVLLGSADRAFTAAPSVSRNDPESFDQVGESVAFGRFSGAGGARAIGGCPHCDPAGSGNAGVVVDPDGEFVQTDFGSAGNGADDHFGAALAVGDFDGDGRDDLAIGAPEKNDSATDDSGRIYVAFGSPAGLDPADFQIFRIVSFPSSTPAAGDRFGAALAAGDYDGDGRDDLFIGSPGRASDDRGFIYFLHGGSGGLAVGAGYVFSEPFLQGSFQEDAHFGSVLAMGDLDGDGVEELAVGVPDKDIDGPNDAGIVYVTRALQPGWIFGDGFESAAVGLWSSQLP
jgi:hypothetical protein